MCYPIEGVRGLALSIMRESLQTDIGNIGRVIKCQVQESTRSRVTSEFMAMSTTIRLSVLKDDIHFIISCIKHNQR